MHEGPPGGTTDGIVTPSVGAAAAEPDGDPAVQRRGDGMVTMPAVPAQSRPRTAVSPQNKGDTRALLSSSWAAAGSLFLQLTPGCLAETLPPGSGFWMTGSGLPPGGAVCLPGPPPLQPRGLTQLPEPQALPCL